MDTEWVDLLSHSGVMVNDYRKVSQKGALLCLLGRTKHITSRMDDKGIVMGHIRSKEGCSETVNDRANKKPRYTRHETSVRMSILLIHRGMVLYLHHQNQTRTNQIQTLKARRNPRDWVL